MAKIPAMLACLVVLTGCDQSNSLDAQVEKCVQSFIRLTKLENPNISQTELARVEAGARLGCLKSASGK